MKKFIYVIVLALSIGFTVTSCTEEEVVPETEAAPNNGGGSGDTR